MCVLGADVTRSIHSVLVKPDRPHRKGHSDPRLLHPYEPDKRRISQIISVKFCLWSRTVRRDRLSSDVTDWKEVNDERAASRYMALAVSHRGQLLHVNTAESSRRYYTASCHIYVTIHSRDNTEVSMTQVNGSSQTFQAVTAKWLCKQSEFINKLLNSSLIIYLTIWFCNLALDHKYMLFSVINNVNICLFSFPQTSFSDVRKLLSD